MKALRVVRPGAFERVEVARPHLEGSGSSTRILIRPQWISLCGSDIPFFTGHKRHLAYPLPPGQSAHECVGRVVESNTDQYPVGDLVLAIPEADLGLAEFFVADISMATRLPPDLDADSSCLIQPLSTVMNGLDRLGDVAGRSVVVVGLGSIGLFFCWLLKQRGAQPIVGVDPLAYRCRWAESLGADQTLTLSSLEVVHAVRQRRLPGWSPPDICIEAVGHQMETLNDCLELVRPRGTVVAFGVPDQPIYALEYEIFFRKNANLMAVVTPDWPIYLEKARDLFRQNRAVFAPWVTHRFPIQQAEQAFNLYAGHGEGIIKTVLDVTRW